MTFRRPVPHGPFDSAEGAEPPRRPAARVSLDRLDAKARAEIETRRQELEDQMRAELDLLAKGEREALGLQDLDAFRDPDRGAFSKAERPTITILTGGLTISHDQLISAGLRGIGYRVKPLDPPDLAALRVGKEFGNRGQCNPTWFTVGNLVKFALHLRDVEGIPTEEIEKNYVFLTADACGPCRFGSYKTEYRKALADAGFPNFRVMVFQQKGGLNQDAGGDEAAPGLEMNPAFFLRIVLGIVVGDVINALSYRIRPYETEKGATDRALADARARLIQTFETPGSLKRLPLDILAIRRAFGAIPVDRSELKPKVAIIGEFWAMTTEGDGNYRMPQFLESEGAEVEVQLVTAWLLYNLWEVRWDTARRMQLDGVDGGRWGLDGVDGRTRVIAMRFADKAMRVVFHTFAHALGLHGYHLPDMDEVARVAGELYHLESRGGEGHMEVAKLILHTVHKKATMTLSVKPFGCMPSSAVSDGVQAKVLADHPDALYLPIETTGDGEVNVKSRVQMALGRAREIAKTELEKRAAEAGVRDWKAAIGKRWGTTHALYWPKYGVAGSTTASLL